jgi:iron(III) transport system ATP-binding protein
VREDIRDLQQKLGLSVVYVTHDQQEALAVSDLVIVMKDGKIAQMGTPHQLYDEPADEFIADFMGEANVLDADIVETGQGSGHLRIGAVGITTAMRDHRTGKARIAVRPEAITLSEGGDGLPGRIVRASFLGQTREYEIETDAGGLFVVRPASAPAFGIGQQVTCHLERVIPLPD